MREKQHSILDGATPWVLGGGIKVYLTQAVNESALPLA